MMNLRQNKTRPLLTWVFLVSLCSSVFAQDLWANERVSHELGPHGGVIWGITGAEMGLVLSGILMLGAIFVEEEIFNDSFEGLRGQGVEIAAAALMAALGLSFAGEVYSWDPALALAIHGGLWGGVILGFMAGAVSYIVDDDLPVLTVAVAVAGLALGLAGGAAIGYYAIDTPLAAGLWIGTPVVVGGTLAALLVLTDGFDQPPWEHESFEDGEY